VQASNNISSTPRQHAGYGIQVGCIHVAAKASGLERNLTGTAEGVGDTGSMAKTHNAELLNQFREALSISAKVRVNGVPDVNMNGIHYLFSAFSYINAFAVGRLGEHLRLKVATVKFGNIVAPFNLHIL
jgi:hypothetical protein